MVTPKSFNKSFEFLPEATPPKNDILVKDTVHPIIITIITIILLLSFSMHNAPPPPPASRASAGLASDPLNHLGYINVPAP